MEDLKIPDELRHIFKKPFGKVYRGDGLKATRKLKEKLKGKKVIVVGDTTLKNILSVGVKPSLAIVDFKTKRGAAEVQDVGKKVLKAKNPPGTITRDLWEKIHSVIEKEGYVILVEGEEDLAVLPCIIEAEWGAVILYGQPDEGIVFTEITEDRKTEAAMILKLILSEVVA